jgi:myo-inositol-1(or 4)-monophosphatase
VTDPDESELLSVADEAAAAAASELIARFGDRDGALGTKSTPTDPVTEADVAAERAVREVLARRRPDDRVLGEEGGATGEGRLRWVVDPLDGTVNYLFGIPAFGVSIACEDESGALVGVVLDVMRGDRFTATRSGDATLNGDPIQASTRGDVATALVATGFGYDSSVRARQAAVVARLLPRVRDIRRIGAASVDMCWCALGRFDAYYERGVKPWDVAAGALICARAGLEVRDLPGDDRDPPGILVAPRAIIAELFEIVR